MTLLEVPCVEVCHGDALHGYAIFFSGGWDAYRVEGRQSLIRVGANFKTKSGAVQAILQRWWNVPELQAGQTPSE